MLWQYLLTPDEQELYEYHMESYLHNAPACLWSNAIGYIICTLLFFPYLTWSQHLIFGLIGLFGMFVTHAYVRFRKHNPNTMSHSAWQMLIAHLLFVTWWSAYFYALSRHANEWVMQQFVIVLTMVSTITIAMIGRFQRIIILSTVVVSLFIATVLMLQNFHIYRMLILQGCILALSQLLFMRSLNTQLSHFFRLKSQNMELVEALRQKNLALEQSNLAQSRYLSAASHDLRQPLHALALLANDAQRKNTHPEVEVTLSKIEQAVDSLSQSFNAMLNLSRLDAGVVKPEFQSLPLQKILNRLQVEFDEVAQQKGLGFTVVPTRVWVQSDEGMLHSILSNFISNALRYTESGRILIGVRRDRDHKIRINVYDTGAGVPVEKARQIFQEYQRLEYAEQRVKGGIGLGLAISERMARLLGVQLQVQSVPDRGSCFGLTMHSIPAPISAVEQKAQEREQVSDHLGGKRVAILDDDETAIDHLEELLSSWQLEVSIALSSDMLKEMIDEEGVFDLIISDYHLGLENETGLDVLLKACQWQGKKRPKCVLVTGDTSAELTQSVRAQGIEILYKPLRPVRLRAYLNTLMGKP